ncbi:ABC transporter ATP-binding protein [Bifidobacterium simiarum]|uniref:ABC transporter ATP-binding protein n=1 Tax=Bifidobacterium simiarum TaxID=2045441 RepID=UPI001BDDB924|nr:ABC transporter ATP-binding protein [Bifidobacterium simiarum]MBT1166777.1 ABC transporter ATP-binding protein [Bifidobacterium simiarum]
MLLDVNDLTREFIRRGTTFAAVDHVSLTLDSGQLLAIVGRSGNGKSTLLNMICGLLRPTSGTVTIDGVQVDVLNDRELSRLRNRTIGFVTQGQTLLANLTVIDNVMLPATFFPADPASHTISDPRPASTSDDPIRARAMALLESLGVADLAESYPRELSGGEMRRVSIARALINEPKLVIADEPTGDLDAQSTEIVMRLLRRVADDGAAVLMVTHDADALPYADRVYTMDAGRLAERDTANHGV